MEIVLMYCINLFIHDNIFENDRMYNCYCIFNVTQYMQLYKRAAKKEIKLATMQFEFIPINERFIVSIANSVKFYIYLQDN